MFWIKGTLDIDNDAVNISCSVQHSCIDPGINVLYWSWNTSCSSFILQILWGRAVKRVVKSEKLFPSEACFNHESEPSPNILNMMTQVKVKGLKNRRDQQLFSHYPLTSKICFCYTELPGVDTATGTLSEPCCQGRLLSPWKFWYGL